MAVMLLMVLWSINRIWKNSTGEPSSKAGTEMQMQRMDVWTWGCGEERVEQIGRLGLTYIHYHV